METVTPLPHTIGPRIVAWLGCQSVEEQLVQSADLRDACLPRSAAGRWGLVVRPALKLSRAHRSQSGQRSTRRYGAFAASVVAALAYPLAVGPKPAISDPATPQPADAGLAQYDAIGVQLAHDEKALTQTQGQLSAVAGELRQQAVSSYVDGGAATPPFQGAGGYDGLLQNEYLATVTGNEQGAVRRLEGTRSALQSEQAKLEADERIFQVADGGANVQVASAASANLDPSAISSLAISGPPDFAVALLKTLGDPLTPQNIQALVAWCQHEGGAWNSPAHFNPFNTSLKMPGSHAINGDGVQSYTSWSEGLTATVATLNSPSYRRILAALSAGSSVQAVESAVASSPWGTHF